MSASPTPSPEQFWPVSVTGWLTFAAVLVAVIRFLLRKFLGWNRDSDRWNEAADALKELSKNVGELLFEIRGVNGNGGINNRLAVIEHDVDEIKQRNADADVFVEIYKADLIERRNRGEPLRRDVDVIVQKISTEPRQ